jgi:hypothetical protein
MILLELEFPLAPQNEISFGCGESGAIYYINVKSPNLDLKQGISFLEREGGEKERKRERVKER